MDKRKAHAFGKDCYLLGRDTNGEAIWLEAASWDCEWYWGFGYIEVYTRQLDPTHSKDIDSHGHWDGLLGKQANGEYLHHLNEALTETTLTDKESWRLSDLMKSFYTLTKCAAVVGRGGSHLSGTSESLVDKDMTAKINEVLLPALFKEVYEIVTP